MRSNEFRILRLEYTENEKVTKMCENTEKIKLRTLLGLLFAIILNGGRDRGHDSSYIIIV